MESCAARRSVRRRIPYVSGDRRQRLQRRVAGERGGGEAGRRGDDLFEVEARRDDLRLEEGAVAIALIERDETLTETTVERLHFADAVEALALQASYLADLPGIALNAGFNSEGLPLGVQLIGPKWSDAQLLDMAASLGRGEEGRIAEGGEC